jgi:hypothetical protein
MSKTKQTAEEALVPQFDAHGISQAIFDTLDDMTPSVPLSFNSLNLEEGESRNFIFLGIKEVTYTTKSGEEETRPAVHLVDGQKGAWNAANVTLVRHFKNIPDNTPVNVRYDGKQGRTKLFTIMGLS